MNARNKMLRNLTVIGSSAMLASLAFAEDKKVDISQVPAAVKATIDANSRGATVEEIELEDEDGRQIYSVEFAAKDGKERELEISPDGKLLKEETGDDDAADDTDDDATNNDDNDANDDDDEVKIDPASAPAAVTAAIKPLLGGATIKAMTKETDDGRVVYEAEYDVDGKENSIEVSADGKVLEIEKGIAISSLPTEVQNAVKQKFPNGTIKVAETVEKKSDATAKPYFEVKVQDAGKMHELKLDSTGKVLKTEDD